MFRGCRSGHDFQSLEIFVRSMRQRLLITTTIPTCLRQCHHSPCTTGGHQRSSQLPTLPGSRLRHICIYINRDTSSVLSYSTNFCVRLVSQPLIILSRTRKHKIRAIFDSELRGMQHHDTARATSDECERAGLSLPSILLYNC